MADTKGCYRCCVVSSASDYHMYMCAATPSNILLMQWYDPLNKFMLLGVSAWFVAKVHTYIQTYIHPFNCPLSGTTRVNRYQRGKTIWILLKQEAVSGSGISWAVCKSAPCSRQTTTPAPRHSVIYRPHALLAAQPNQQRQSTEGQHYQCRWVRNIIRQVTNSASVKWQHDHDNTFKVLEE